MHFPLVAGAVGAQNHTLSGKPAQAGSQSPGTFSHFPKHGNKPEKGMRLKIAKEEALEAVESPLMLSKFSATLPAVPAASSPANKLCGENKAVSKM